MSAGTLKKVDHRALNFIHDCFKKCQFEVGRSSASHFVMLQQSCEIWSLSRVRNFEDEIVGDNGFELSGISAMSIDPGEEFGRDIEELFTTHFGCRK